MGILEWACDVLLTIRSEAPLKEKDLDKKKKTTLARLPSKTPIAKSKTRVMVCCLNVL